MINQPFYEMLVRNAREIQGAEKDCLFEEEYANRIRVLKPRYSDTTFYQAIDDAVATEKILNLKKNGYSIKFDEYNPEHYYANGNIKYFSCFYNYYEEQEQRKVMSQLAEKLTNLQAKRIFPEEFYFGRAYYQMKEQGKDVDDFELNAQYCARNPDNFYVDGSLKYFWINYFGSMDDFQKREEVLEFADELPAQMALELKKADELAEHYDKIQEREEDEIRKFMRTSSFSKKYQKALKRMKDDEMLDEREFAKEFLEESKQHVRQKRLNDDRRVRKLTMDEMITEMDNMAEYWYKYKAKLGEELCSRLYDNEVDFDDVIQLLSDVILTEEEAKCVAIAWPLTKRVDCITNENMTAQHVQELFPELHENTEIHKKSAEIVAKFYNLYTEKQKQRQTENIAKKLKTFQTITAKQDEIEL